MTIRTTLEDQVRQVQTTAACFDRSPSGKVEVRGPEAPEFLHNLCTNEVKGLPLGGGCEAFFCDQRARSLFHGRIYHCRTSGEHSLWIDVTPHRNAALVEHLNRHLIAEHVELADRTAEFGQLHLAGPTASAVLAAAIGQPIPDLHSHQHMERQFGNQTVVHVRRHDPLGAPGYDLVFRTEQTDEVRRQLASAGAALANDETWECLRILAGTPEYGRDFDDQRFVVEIGRPAAISFDKGCYLGQEPIVMARDRAGFVNRSLKQLLFADDTVNAGDKLFSPKEAGWVTSVARLPDGQVVGLGYVRRGFDNTDAVLHVGSENGTAARVLSTK